MLMTHLDLLLFLAIGVFSGLLSGLLGVGGGIIVVPMLLLVLKTNPLFADTNLMHIAAGTSLAAMIVTSLSSAYAYHRHNAVIWPVFWYTLPGICIGMLFGSMLTTHLNVTILSNLFSVFLILTALHLFRDNAPKPRAPTDAVQHQSTYTPKNILFISIASTLVGGLSALFGIGGGIILVPLFLTLQLSIREASGTSALCGAATAIVGTLVLSQLALDPGSYKPSAAIQGYIYWPAAVSIAASAVICAPIGTRLAYTLQTKSLKRLFSVMLLLSAWKLISY